MNDTDVLIKIITAFESGGIDAAKKAAEELQKEVDANSNAGKTLAGALDLLNGKGQAAGQVFNGLKGILAGGQGAARGFAGVVQGLGGALGMAAGPLAILTTSVGLAITAWQKYKQSQEEAAEAAKKAAEEAARAAAAAADQIKAIHDTSMAERVEEFRQMGQAAKEAADQASAVANAQLALENAKLDNQIAQLEAQKGGASKEEAEAIDAQISALRNQKSLNSNQAQQDALEREREGLVSERENATDALAAEQRFNAGYRGDKSAWDTLSGEEKKAISSQIRQEMDELLADESFGQDLDESERENAARKAVKQRHLAREEAAKSRLGDVNAKIENWNATSGLRAQTLQIQQDTLLTQGQTQQDAHARNIDEIRKDQAEQDAAAAAANAPKPTVGGLWNEAAGQIGRGQWYQGQRYDIDNGQIQQQARQALADAGRTMAAGKSGDDARVMSELVKALEEMGAVVADKNKMMESLTQAVALMRQQIKNGRG